MFFVRCDPSVYAALPKEFFHAAFGPAIVGEIWFFSLKNDHFPGGSSLG